MTACNARIFLGSNSNMSKVSLRTYFSDEKGATSNGVSSSVIESQLDVLRENKLDPICDDFLFDEFHANSLGSSGPSALPVVSVVYDNWGACSGVVEDLLGGLVDDYSGDSMFVRGGPCSELSKVASGDLPEDWLLWTRSDDVILDRMSFGVMRWDRIVESMISDSALVLLVLDLKTADSWSDLVRYRLKSLRPFFSKLHVVLVGGSAPLMQSQLPALVWNLCRSLKTPEHPPLHFDAGRDLYRALLELPSRALFQKLVAETGT